MGKLLGLLIATSLFAGGPALLLGAQFGLALGVAYFAIALTLLSIFWELTEIRDELKRQREQDR
jgi:high-affinity Fe2+/Pb2+ permease